jgi:hypothetical protein
LRPRDPSGTTADLLARRNRSLLRDLRALISLLSDAHIPTGLAPYRQRILSLCHEREGRIERNLSYLALDISSILPDVLAATNLAVERVRFLSTRLATPVLRASDTDALCLWTIEWLHQSHPEAAHYPPAMCDGDVAVLPLVDLIPLYFFPSIEQRGLLFQPLLFHEFGHLLYACHKAEMDDLVGELQRAVEDALVPGSSRNDAHASAQAERRALIVRVWYRWAQELFCDAVGFDIGGPAFLHAFGVYLSRLDASDFARRPEQLALSHHPITALRVQFLTRRAESAGFGDFADRMRQEWAALSDVLGVVTDHFGFYDDPLQNVVEGALNDMLTEATPLHFSAGDVSPPTTTTIWGGPVPLVNAAWRAFEADSDGYTEWERAQILKVSGM